MGQIKRGIGLIEAILYLVVGTAVLVGGMVFFRQASESARVDNAVRSIVSIQSGVRSLYHSNSRFPAEGSDLASAVILSGSVPGSLVSADGDLINEWGGSVGVFARGGGFIIDYGDVPREACVRMAPYTMQGVGVAGYGIAAVSINGTPADTNGDGQVTPDEALSVCSGGGTVANTEQTLRLGTPIYASFVPVSVEEDGSGLDLRWVFVPDPASKLDPFEVDELLEAGTAEPIVEVSRRTESEVGDCPAGLEGSTSRTREVVVMSDGSEVPGAWGEWDSSACHAVEVSQRTETENGQCPTGLVGQTTRSRQVAVMSDGSEVAGAWSGWDSSACHAVEVSQRTETQTGQCPAGLVGQTTRSRQIAVMSDGSEVAGAWSGWDSSACQVVQVSSRTESESSACGAGYTGNQTRQRQVAVMSDGSEVPGSWGAWNRSACQVENVIVETRTFKTQSWVSCGYMVVGLQSTTEIKDRWSTGQITSRGVKTTQGQCFNGQGNVSVDVRAYTNCGSFGGQSYVVNRYTVYQGRTGSNYVLQGAVGSASCGWH